MDRIPIHIPDLPIQHLLQLLPYLSNRELSLAIHLLRTARHLIYNPLRIHIIRKQLHQKIVKKTAS